MLESVTRAPAHQPDVLQIRMPVDQKISIRSVLVLAHPCFQQRSIFQLRESSPQNQTSPRNRARSHVPIPGLRIERRPMLVDRQLESTAVNRRNRVRSFAERNPAWHLQRPRRSAEKENFLTRGTNPPTHNVGKTLW